MYERRGDTVFHAPLVSFFDGLMIGGDELISDQIERFHPSGQFLRHRNPVGHRDELSHPAQELRGHALSS